MPDTVAMEKTRDHASGSRQVVVFGLGEERYATDVTRVQEIIRWTEPRSVSSSLPAVRGVINLRGKIIPVCDLQTCLGAVVLGAGRGLEDRRRRDRGRRVRPDRGRGPRGADARQVELDQVPEHASQAGFMDGIAKAGDQLIVLLEPDRLFGGALDTAALALAA